MLRRPQVSTHSLLSNGWLELESDPGLFTLLLEEFGVQGVQVEEIYDLQKPIDGPVYGFIFLFKWIEERRARRKTNPEDESYVLDEKRVNSMFFAKQVISNSCATHALLSVLLNCEKIKIGDMLTRLKEFCKGMTPEDKGTAIGNMGDLIRAHNAHARPEPLNIKENEKQGISGTTITIDAFHFVSYVPINGRLYELDGLKQSPIDHGPCGEGDDWTEKFFREVITERLNSATGIDEIRFSLMAVVPCRRQQLEHKLSTLKTNRQIILEALQQMVKVTDPNIDVKSNVKSSSETVTTNRPRRNTGNRGALAAHDYAKSLSIDGEIKQETTVDYSVLESADLQTRDGVEISIAIKHESGDSVNVSTADVSRPISIDFTPLSGKLNDSGETTDTASEGGSSKLSSPNQSMHTSPVSVKKEGLSPVKSLTDKSPMTAPVSDEEKKSLGIIATTSSMSGTQLTRHQGFSPKDLLTLLKTVEIELESCELKLEDEREKRKRYVMDDCRRTHNYDEFIVTFLSMLAEQGHLTELVEQQLNKKRSSSSPASLKVQKTQKKRKR